MKKFSLKKDDIKLVKNLPINIKEVKDSEEPDVINTINNFNSKIEWDEMFTLDEVDKRLKEGQRFFLFYFKDTLVGHTWFSPKVVFFGENKTKEIKINYPKIYGYNLFIDSSKHDYKLFDAYNYSSYCLNRIFSEGYDEVYVYVDDWNRASIISLYKIGFKPLEWN